MDNQNNRGGCPQGMHRVDDPRIYNPNNQVFCQLDCDLPGQKILPDGSCKFQSTEKPTQPAYHYQTSGDDIAALLGFSGIAAAIFFGMRYLKNQKQAKIAAAPEQPFNVDVVVRPIQADKILDFVRGKPLTHNLEVRVDIGLKDWERIKKAGYYDSVLFDYPDPTDASSRETRQYYVRDLKIHGAASFYNLGDANNAKEELINRLYNLREAIEAQKAGPDRERLQI